jgi:hypothetical protein
VKGEATIENLLAAQEPCDSHFVDSPKWEARQGGRRD